jgi:hypothetical protein
MCVCVCVCVGTKSTHRGPTNQRSRLKTKRNQLSVKDVCVHVAGVRQLKYIKKKSQTKTKCWRH